MSLQEEYAELKKYFGESTINIEFILDSDLEILHPQQFSKIKLTHRPTKKIILGEKYDTQIQNAVAALRQLKSELSEW